MGDLVDDGARRGRYLGSVAIDWVAVEGFVAGGAGVGSYTSLATTASQGLWLQMLDIPVSFPEDTSVDADRSRVSCELLPGPGDIHAFVLRS